MTNPPSLPLAVAAREQAHFDSRRYLPPPWADEPWARDFHYRHFPHLSLKAPGEIAYTKSADEGARDIQRRMKAGKYLQRYFSAVLTPPQIAEWAARARHAATSQSPSSALPSVRLPTTGLEIIASADELVSIYKSGPPSCMSFPTDAYQGSTHPARAYAEPSDIRVAIYRRDGRITARKLICPAKRIFQSGGYGDTQTLAAELMRAGYSAIVPQYTPAFCGARILAIPNLKPTRGDREAFCAPSVDNSALRFALDADPQFLRLVTLAEYNTLPLDRRGVISSHSGLAILDAI